MKKRKKRAPRFGDSAFQDSSARYQDRWALEDPDSVDMDDLIERYGKYLDENDQPLKGINPSPKYYVVPKEPPPEPREPEPPKTEQRTTRKRAVKAVKKPLPKVTPKRVEKPAPEPEPPVVVKPVRKEAPKNTIPVKVIIKKK